MKVIRGLSEQSISLGLTSFSSPEDDLIFTEHYYRSLRESKKQMNTLRDSVSSHTRRIARIGKKCVDFLYTR